MGVFRYIWNVVSGRFAHWNTTNNQVITDLYDRIKKLNPEYQKILTKFLSSNSIIVDHLLSPSKSKKERLLGTDPKKIEKEEFKQIHKILLESMIGVFIKLNPSHSKNLSKALEIVTNRKTNESEISQFINSQNKIQLSTISDKVFEQIKNSIKSDLEPKFMDSYQFTVLYGSTCKETFKKINSQFQN